MEDINNNTIFNLLKKTPSFINLVKLKDVNNDLYFEDTINIWKVFKKIDKTYLNNYSDVGTILNNVFNENIDYKKKEKKISLDNKLLPYKNFLNKNKLFYSMLQTHCKIKDKKCMIVLYIKNTESIFINIKDDNIWKKNIKNYLKNKKYIKMYKEIKKGPFTTFKLTENLINKKILDILWKENIFEKNCLFYAMIIDD